MDGGYGMNNGTSFAADRIRRGRVIWSVNPDLRPATVAKAILSTAVDLGDAGRGTGLRRRIGGCRRVRRGERLVAPADADTTTPVARIVQPLNGTTISGKTIVTAQATDASGVADVVLSVDGIPLPQSIRETAGCCRVIGHFRRLPAGIKAKPRGNHYYDYGCY